MNSLIYFRTYNCINNVLLLKPTQWEEYIYGYKIQICEQVEIKNDILIV